MTTVDSVSKIFLLGTYLKDINNSVTVSRSELELLIPLVELKYIHLV